MATATRKCTGCRKRYRQENESWRQAPVGWFHDMDCQIVYARNRVQKKHDQQAKKKRAEFRQKKIEVKGLKYWIKETQKVVNQYVRLRDKGKPCISCGKYETELRTKALHGSVWDAGHFKTTKARPELRFDLRNINGQCRDCNGFNAGRVKEQELEIVKRFGQGRLDWLTGYHAPKHYTIEYLARLRRVLRKRMRKKGWI